MTGDDGIPIVCASDLAPPTAEPKAEAEEKSAEPEVKAVELPVKSRGRGRPRTRPIGEQRPADARRARKEKQSVEKEAAPTRVLRKRGVSKEDVEADDEEDMTLGELAKRSKSSTRDASEV